MAINFPSTSGQATDGSFTHTASGITWAWDGTTWKATGVTSSYVLPAATANDLGGIKVGTNLSIASGVLSASGGEITVQEEGSSLSTAATTLNFTGRATASGTGAVKTINIPGVSDLGINATARVLYQAGNGNTDILPAGNSGEVLTSGGDGVVPSWSTASATLDTRSTFTATTTSLANNAADLNVSITAHKSYMLLKIKPSIAAWVVLYVDAASRTADTNRVQGADPAPDAGVIAEVITTTANQEVKMSPGVLGWHQDPGNDAVDTVFCKVVNKSGSTGTCTVSLTVVQLEA